MIRVRTGTAVLASLLAAVLACSCKSRSRATRPRDAGTLAIAPAVPAGHDAAAPAPQYQSFATAGEALARILATRPRIIGVGEFHQTSTSAPVRPTIERFIDLLDGIAPLASDLVVETWVESGGCGEKEQAVNQDVRATTERPPEVEDHLTRLLGGAKARGVAPHVLVMGCDDYQSLLGDGGAVDYDAVLHLIERKLAETATRVWTKRQQAAAEQRAIVLYGGALHNDLYPLPGLEDISYAAKLDRLSSNGYVEIDMIVPELVEETPLVTSRPWYPLLAEAVPDRVLLIEQAPRSYILILHKNARAR